MNAQTRLPAEIFKLAIDLGRYYCWTGMCITLSELESEGVITGTERLLAAKEIDRYMATLKEGAPKREGDLYLRTTLRYLGLPYDNKATTAIYLDWDSRPFRREHRA